MPVVAPSGGVVVLAESLVVRGNAILIDHGWGVVTGYWHLSEVGVAVGQHVAQGERIGAVGNTGLSTGAHLHWEMWVNGVAVNALSWLDPDSAASVLGPTP
jgi:murein DD-endopeptidase MepM/ murein hydrolase activator NlpD